ncbi:MAG: hypothetical protein KIT18_07375, partial [Burkholderiales bacterium]|nr:hypothetical protein [Burkholderiales bacterium]
DARAKALPRSPRGRWHLRKVKARLGEPVQVRHGAVADNSLSLNVECTGQLLINALRASPFRNVEFEQRRSAMPVRDINL